MAATKFGFLTQPNSTVQGYRLTGGASPLQSMLGVEQYQSTTTSNQAIQVACLNADGTLDNTSVVAVTIAIGTNPTSGSTLGGTLVKNAVAGVATFDDLAITLGGVGYTLSATGSLTTATSNAFNLTTVYRVNPRVMSGAITANGAYVGPYRFRGNNTDLKQNTQRIEVRGTFVGTIQVIVVDPGADQTAAANQMVVYTTTVPTSQVFEAGGDCDIYFFSSAWTSGTATCEVYY